MSMDNSIKEVGLVIDNISDFKLELGRVKDELTSAVNLLLNINSDLVSTSPSSLDLDYYLKNSAGINDLSIAVRKINEDILNKGMDIDFQIDLGINQDFSSFLDTYVSEYGLFKFYKNDKNQILLDFDNFLFSLEANLKSDNQKVKTPEDLPIIPIYEESGKLRKIEDKVELTPEKEEEEEGEEIVQKISIDEKNELDKQIDILCSIPDSEITSSPEEKWGSDYYIKSFYINIKVRNKTKKVELYAGMSNDGRWLATKNNMFIFAKSEFKVENLIDSFASKAISGTPDGFISWEETGGRKKRSFYDNLPQIGEQGKTKKGEISDREIAIIAHNLNTSSHFFIRDEVPLSRRYYSIAEKRKEDSNLFSALSSLYPEVAGLDQDFAIYIDEVNGVTTFIIDESVSNHFFNFVQKKISDINNSLNEAYRMAAISKDMEKAESARFSLSKDLDDLISVCRVRDRILYDKFLSYKNDNTLTSNQSFDLKDLDEAKIDKILVCNLLQNENTKLGSKLLNLCQIMFFASSGYLGSFAANLIRGRSVDFEKLDSSFIYDAFENFGKSLRTQVSSKIKEFFSNSSTDLSRSLFCRFMSASINLGFLYKNSYNFAAKSVRMGWNYISCPTCKKDIYYSKYKDATRSMEGIDLVPIISETISISQEKAKAFIDLRELSDYEEKRYSLFRDNGSLITTSDLRKEGASHGFDWDEILRLISSNNQDDHKKGIEDRQKLLKAIGAKAIGVKRGQGSASVFRYKTKCPFSDGRLPESITLVSDFNKSDITLKDFSCGLSLNVDDIVNSDRKLDPYELQSAPYDPHISAEEKLNGALDIAIQNGKLTEAERQNYINELIRRKSGGWKFSNVMFRCPCKPNSFIDKNLQAVKDGKFKYLASPITGFFKKDLYNSGMISPPTDEVGSPAEIEDLTAAYIICGDLTSLSSFCRDTSDPNSLYGILKSKSEAYHSGDVQVSRAYIANFIETLIQLGVDFNDIIPFVDKIYSEKEEKTAISSMHKMILDSFTKFAAHSTQMDRYSHDEKLNLTRLDTVGDLKLVCSNGHRFKIIDSIRFGQTHTGHFLGKRSINGASSSFLVDIFKKGGKENILAGLASIIPGDRAGNTLLTRVDNKYILQGMKNFSEWDGVWDKKKGLSEYYYTDEDGTSYIFNSRENSVIWGDYNESTSIMPFLKRDNKTRLFISANPHEIGDGIAGGDSDEGYLKKHSDIRSMQEFKDEVSMFEKINDDEDGIKTETQNHRAKLDIYYSPLAVIIQSALSSIKDFCDRATSTTIDAPIHGVPTTLKNESEVVPLVKDVIKEFYERQAMESIEAGGDRESVERSMQDVLDEAFGYFEENYLKNIRSQDLRILNMIEPSISPIEKSSISRAILMAMNAAIGRYSANITDLSSRFFDPKLKNKIESDLFSQETSLKIDEIVKLIKSNIEPPRGTAVKGLLKGESKNMISGLQASEYTGRVLMMSSALYLSEAMSRLYRKYLDRKSQRYIGVDIGLDFSSFSKLISKNPTDGLVFMLSEEQISSIPNTFPFREFLEELNFDMQDDEDEEGVGEFETVDLYQKNLLDQILEYENEQEKNEADRRDVERRLGKDNPKYKQIERAIKEKQRQINELELIRKDYIKIIDKFIEKYSSSFMQFFDEIKDEIGRLSSACTNYKYTEMAVNIIRESLLNKIKLDNSLDEKEKDVTRIIIDRCITNSPITTISLSSGDKYHVYYSGDDLGGKEGTVRSLPVFSAEVVESLGLEVYAPPVFALSGSKNSYSNLGIGTLLNPPPGKAVILYKGIQSDKIEPFPTTLPEEVKLSGWQTGIISSKGLKIKRKDISLYHHPFTLSILKDGTRSMPSLSKDVIGFINSFLNYNSASGFNFGPLTPKSGRSSLFPTPYAYGTDGSGGTHIGLYLPLKYDESENDVKQTHAKIAPFFDARIPIEIPTNEPGKTISVDISDFLVRDPPHIAQQILNKISKRYLDYKKDLVNFAAYGPQKKQELLDECREEISTLFDSYRNLPYSITNTSSSSAVIYQGGLKQTTREEASSVEPSRTPFIPMADFVTCNRILNLEEFSPEFGGHSFWMSGDTDSAPVIRGAIEQMIIDINSLDVLADEMNSLLNDDEIKITARDLLDPHNGVFDKIYKKVRKDFQKLRSNNDSDDVDIVKKTIEEIKRITSYSVGEEYTPLASITAPSALSRMRDSYRADNFWYDKIPSSGPRDKLPNWYHSTGRFYSITSSTRQGAGEPLARIKVMNEIFPFNNEDGTGRAERLTAVQNPESNEIIKQSDFNYSSFLYGKSAPPKLIGSVKYAQGISDFFSQSIIEGLRLRIKLEKERRDIEYDIGKRKLTNPISKKAQMLENRLLKVRVAPMDSVGILRVSRMMALVSMFTK